MMPDRSARCGHPFNARPVLGFPAPEKYFSPAGEPIFADLHEKKRPTANWQGPPGNTAAPKRRERYLLGYFLAFFFAFLPFFAAFLAAFWSWM